MISYIDTMISYIDTMISYIDTMYRSTAPMISYIDTMYRSTATMIAYIDTATACTATRRAAACPSTWNALSGTSSQGILPGPRDLPVANLDGWPWPMVSIAVPVRLQRSDA